MDVTNGLASATIAMLDTGDHTVIRRAQVYVLKAAINIPTTIILDAE